MSEWLDEIKAQTIPSIADRLGLRRGRLGSYSPCPLCGAEKRGGNDGRGPLGINGNQKGTQCFCCNEQIDIVDLCSLILQGRRVREFSGADWAAFRASCEGKGLVSHEAGGSSRSRAHTHVRSLGDGVAAMLGRPSGAMPAVRKIRGITSSSSTASEDETVHAPPPGGGGGGGGGRGGSERGFPWDPERYAGTPETLWSEEGAHVLAYVRGRGLSEGTIRAWGLGALLEKGEDGRVVAEFLAIPMKDEHGRVVNYRFRSVPGPCLRCDGTDQGCSSCRGKGEVLKAYRPCTGRPLPLFGAHTLSPDRTLPVIVLEGELDVIAAWEFGYRDNVVTGTAGAGTFKQEWADLIEPYDAFILGLDGDEKGNEGATKIAEMMGRYRCSRLLLPEKDLGACLEKGVTSEQIERAMEMAKPMVGVSMEKADHYAADLETLISNPAKLRGLPTRSPKLNEKLAGIRPGLTVITGDSGCGKTTWSTWIGKGLAEDGVGVMVTSYEQKPIGTIQKLLRMELGEDFTKVSQETRRAALDRIAATPLWVLDHYGHMGFQEVLDSIRYARRRFGVRWFLVDHLGFLVGEDEEDERRAVEKVIRALALLANTEDVSVWLICHPSNSYVQERRRVMLKDLKGASAIRQDANEGIVIERGTVKKTTPWCHAIVHLDKVRSEFGQAGTSVVLPFDPIACTYADSPSNLPTYKGGGLAVDPSSLPDDPPPRSKGGSGARVNRKKREED